jgi:endonuclease/exonuclease/phosphatase family metal-dependent hydrolase
MPTTVVTWNLEGRAGVDAHAVAEVLRGLECDVACLQEVQRKQCHAIQGALRFDHARWSFKHWPVGHRPAEGHAILTRGALQVEAYRISEGEPFWSHQRRIAQIARVGALDGLVLVNTHLGSGRVVDARGAQIRRLLARVKPDIVVGDLNEWEGPALDGLRGTGLRDAWRDVHHGTTYKTNWSHADRSAAPDQRLDWVFVSDAVRVVDARLGDWRVTAALSDHVPLAVTVELAGREPSPPT